MKSGSTLARDVCEVASKQNTGDENQEVRDHAEHCVPKECVPQEKGRRRR